MVFIHYYSISITKYSRLHESFITEYLFWNRIQEIMKVLPQKFGAIWYMYMVSHTYMDISEGC